MKNLFQAVRKAHQNRIVATVEEVDTSRLPRVGRLVCSWCLYILVLIFFASFIYFISTDTEVDGRPSRFLSKILSTTCDGLDVPDISHVIKNPTDENKHDAEEWIEFSSFWFLFSVFLIIPFLLAENNMLEYEKKVIKLHYENQTTHKSKDHDAEKPY